MYSPRRRIVFRAIDPVVDGTEVPAVAISVDVARRIGDEEDARGF